MNTETTTVRDEFWESLGVEWHKYPRLAEWFRERPLVNTVSIELAQLIRDVTTTRKGA